MVSTADRCASQILPSGCSLESPGRGGPCTHASCLGYRLLGLWRWIRTRVQVGSREGPCMIGSARCRVGRSDHLRIPSVPGPFPIRVLMRGAVGCGASPHTCGTHRVCKSWRCVREETIEADAQLLYSFDATVGRKFLKSSTVIL